MNARQRSVLLVMLALLPLPPAAATSVAAQSRRPLILSFGTHSLTVPWHPQPVTNRLNPALMLGTESASASGERWRLHYGASIGFFHDHWWMTGVSVVPEIGFGGGLAGGFHSDLHLGLGYMHYFWRRRTLELKDGRYVQTTDWGRPSVIVPLSLTVGYRGDPDHPISVAPFVSVRWGVQGLFMEEVPVMTHLLLLAGVRIPRGLDDPSRRR